MLENIKDFFTCIYAGYALGGFRWKPFRNGYLLAWNLIKLARQLEPYKSRG